MKQNNEYINNYEKSISLMVLSCINDLEIKVGKNKLVAILQGSESNYIFENEFNKNPFYGLLQNYNSKQLIKIIERLVDIDLVELKSLDLGFYTSVLDLTKTGKIAISANEIDAPQLTNILIHSKSPILSDDNNILFEKLRNLRKEISKSINKPAFIICTDKVLREVARQEPGDVDSLLSIKGIGNHFIEEYSSLFLNEIELNTSIV